MPEISSPRAAQPAARRSAAGGLGAACAAVAERGTRRPPDGCRSPTRPSPPATSSRAASLRWSSRSRMATAPRWGWSGAKACSACPLVYGTDRFRHRELRAMRRHARCGSRRGRCGGLRMEPGAEAAAAALCAGAHAQVAHTAACNGRHQTEQRLARWLLMAHDRADEDRFPITHELLSMMLGLRRAGVSVAAGSLQRAGLIRYGRGQMEVTRPGGAGSRPPANASPRSFGTRTVAGAGGSARQTSSASVQTRAGRNLSVPAAGPPAACSPGQE